MNFCEVYNEFVDNYKCLEDTNPAEAPTHWHHKVVNWLNRMLGSDPKQGDVRVLLQGGVLWGEGYNCGNIP